MLDIVLILTWSFGTLTQLRTFAQDFRSAQLLPHVPFVISPMVPFYQCRPISHAHLTFVQFKQCLDAATIPFWSSIKGRPPSTIDLAFLLTSTLLRLLDTPCSSLSNYSVADFREHPLRTGNLITTLLMHIIISHAIGFCSATSMYYKSTP